MNRKVVFAYSIIIFLWGSAFPAVTVGLESFSAAHLSSFRLLLGAGVLLLFAFLKKVSFPAKEDIPVILLLGFFGFTLYHTALSFGQAYVTAGAASLLVTTTPVFSAFLAAAFLRERLSKRRWVGSITAFFGVAMISIGMEGSILGLTSGALLILTAAFGESIYFVFQTNYLKKYGFFPFTIYTIIAGSLFMILFIPGIAADIATASPASLFAVLYLGLFPTLLPYFALTYITAKTGAAEATSSLFVTPVVALFLSWLLLGEVPTYLALTGGMLTLAGVGLFMLNGAGAQERSIGSGTRT